MIRTLDKDVTTMTQIQGTGRVICLFFWLFFVPRISVIMAVALIGTVPACEPVNRGCRNLSSTCTVSGIQIASPVLQSPQWLACVYMEIPCCLFYNDASICLDYKRRELTDLDRKYTAVQTPLCRSAALQQAGS